MDTPPPTPPIKRRLTAILAADAVGYSRQMGADEEGTLRILAAQRAIIDRIIAAHEGRIVGTAGDSVLAEFASSVEAVRCAVEMQEALQTRNETLPESERLVFRVGVNLGDVMVDGENILGDGVNVAARLEGIAEPGGICISSSVYDQIAGKLSLGFLDIGEQSLKNISRPIRVYRLDRSGSGTVVARPAVRGGGGRGRWLAAGAVALVAVLGFGAWQAGFLQRSGSTTSAGAAPSVPTLPGAFMPVPPTPPARVAAPPSEETRMKLQIAEAERAKAEAELAKARAEAETARLRAQAPATAKPAPASSAPSPAAPSSIPAAAATAAPARSVAPSALRRCGPFEDLRPYADELPVRIVDGDVVIERGLPDAPGYLSLHGRPGADGRLVLAGTLVSSGARTKGARAEVRYEGGYADGKYTLIGHQGKRVCTLVIRATAPR